LPAAIGKVITLGVKSNRRAVELWYLPTPMATDFKGEKRKLSQGRGRQMKNNALLAISIFLCLGTFAYGLYDLGPTPAWLKVYGWPLAITTAAMMWRYLVWNDERS